MLNTPELAMNRKRKVITVCNKQKRVWDSREEAKDFFLEAMMNSDGSEHDRYSSVYIQLQNRLDLCMDKEE